MIRFWSPFARRDEEIASLMVRVSQLEQNVNRLEAHVAKSNNEFRELVSNELRGIREDYNKRFEEVRIRLSTPFEEAAKGRSRGGRNWMEERSKLEGEHSAPKENLNAK